MNNDFFISYCREDETNVAFPLHQHLTNLGLKVWLDRKQIMPGNQIYEKIKDAIKSSKGVIAVIAEPYLTRGWTVEELKLTLQLEQTKEQSILLPIFHRVSPETVWEFFPCLKNRAFEPLNSKSYNCSSPNDRIIADRIVNWYLDKELKEKGIHYFNWNKLYQNEHAPHIRQLLCLLELCEASEENNRANMIGYTNAIMYTSAILVNIDERFADDTLYTLSNNYCKEVNRYIFRLDEPISNYMLITCRTMLNVLIDRLKAQLDSG